MVDVYSNENELEKAICLKSEVEFKTIIREWEKKPLSKEQLAKIDENIKSNYKPFSVFEKAADIRVEYYLLPLIKKLIQSEVSLRNTNDVLFTKERLDILGYYFRNLAKKYWEYILRDAYEDAISHVIHNIGYIAEYKDLELQESRDKYIRLAPNGLYSLIDEYLQKEFADAKIRKFQSHKENTQARLHQISISGSVSDSTIIIGDNNEIQN